MYACIEINKLNTKMFNVIKKPSISFIQLRRIHTKEINDIKIEMLQLCMKDKVKVLDTEIFSSTYAHRYII
jgi:hypothetical protein